MDITIDEVLKLAEGSYVYIDMRGSVAYDHGHIPGAVCMDSDEFNIDDYSGRKLIVYCSYGEKSVDEAERLRGMGYDAYTLAGGFREWLFHSSDELSTEELQRYDRQIILPDVGIEGQKKLKNSKVLIVGAGGLGAPAAMYLAGAGIGTIGIADADTVSVTNLHRQIIHSTHSAGINKAESAKDTMADINDLIDIRSYPYFITPDNIEDIIEEYDFIIDAADNFETKFLINDACVLNRKAFCHAGVLQYEGQVMTYVPGDYPCYRCIFEEIPHGDDIPNCSNVGIIGPMAGVIGSIQALEAIKYILGAGELLVGKMYIFNGITMNSRLINISKRNCNCRVCGDVRNITDIKDNANEYKKNSNCSGRL